MDEFFWAKRKRSLKENASTTIIRINFRVPEQPAGVMSERRLSRFGTQWRIVSKPSERRWN